MRRLTRAVTAAVIGAVLLVGCGSTDDGATDEAAADTTLATVPPDPESDEPDEATESDEEEDPGSSSAGDVDTCAIVALLDVEGLLGEPGEPVDDTSDLAASCQVKPTDPESRAGIRLTVESSRGPENYAQQRELLGVDSEAPAFGDQAFHTGPYLFVLQGDTLAFLQVLRSPDNGLAVDDAELEAAMEIVLAELG